MKRVAVFMLFGQSNAVGHGTCLEEKDKIKEPLKNVFGLNREPNQSFDTEKLKFTGYTSYGMNLAETQDNTYSIANCLAKRWQSDIDNGIDLPDLYIIHIALGAQGVYGMWSPHRPKKLIPGVQGDCDISMYPLTIHILSLLKKHFEINELEPDYMGIHWRGGEQETWQHTSNLEGRLKNDYLTIFNGMREAIGCNAPIILHRMPFVQVMKNADPTGKCFDSMNYINGLFSELANEMSNTTVFDVRSCPFYDESTPDYNILRCDLIHYQGKTNDWVAGEILRDYKERRK